jgi:predicted TIM-barrel enzyme
MLEKLRAEVSAGRPIIGAGCSAGIVAKFAERGGADLIICYSTGRSRIMGLPTTRVGNSNVDTLAMYDEIANVVDTTPIIAGIEGCDPTERRLPALVKKFHDKGFNGVINFPSVGDRPAYAAAREVVGLGLSREYELIRVAREFDMLTLGYAYSVEQGVGLTDAGVDVLVPHAGWTTGGAQGSETASGARTLDQTLEHVQAIVEACVSRRPELICVCHGGSIAEPQDTRVVYERTQTVGFVGASSIERIPIERAIEQTLVDFKSVPLATA